MKIQIESTEVITNLGGVPVRVWNGVTESGIACLVFVHRIAVHRTVDCGDFDRELEEHQPPQPVLFDEILRRQEAGQPIHIGDLPVDYQQGDATP